MGTTGGNGASRSGSPMMVHRQLGRRLRAMREATGRSRDDVVASKLMSRSKLEGIEHGRTMVRPGDAYELGRIYGASAEELETLRALAAATNEAGWWQEFGEGLVKGFDIYLDLGSGADAILMYQPSQVAGLFQTEAYARAVEPSTDRMLSEEQVRRNVDLRMQRQRLLLAPSRRVQVTAVLGEAALRTMVGGEQVMQDQCKHLQGLAGTAGLDLRILPFTAGAHPGALGPFTVFEFEDPEDPAVAYIEGYTGARYNDRQDCVVRYRQVHRALCEMSVSVEEFQL